MEKPRSLQGFRDYLPATMRVRQHLLDTVRGVYESYGYAPLDTPALEFKELLTGKYGDDEKLIYHFKDHGGREVALRYDLTVPLARVVSTNHDLPRPFKRYQMGPVWRADSPQAGRFREFMQFDVDCVGTNSPLADAEILMIMHDCLSALGFKSTRSTPGLKYRDMLRVDTERHLLPRFKNQGLVPSNVSKFTIRVSHRGVFGAVLRALKVPSEHHTTVLRLVDKIDKVGAGEIKAKLLEIVPKPIISQMFELFDQSGKDLIGHLHSILSHDQAGLDAVSNLSDIFNLVSDLDSIKIDLSIVRGLSYYTGLIYEAVLDDHPGLGSVYAGGRYDDLMRDLAGVDMPAVGTSLGVDRLMTVLSTSDVDASPIVLTVFGGFESDALQLSTTLRQAGLNVALAFGQEKLGKQLHYADNLGARVTLIFGEPEILAGKVVVRNMKSGEQTEFRLDQLDDLISALKK